MSGYQHKKEVMLNAYFSIEASVIIPMIVFICISIGYLGIYIYDRSVMKLDSYRVALYGATSYREEPETRYEKAYIKMMNLIPQRYPHIEPKTEIKAGETITVSMEADFDLPFRFMENFWDDRDVRLDVTSKSKYTDATMVIRSAKWLLKSDEK